MTYKDMEIQQIHLLTKGQADRDALIRELLAALVKTRPWIEDDVASYVTERGVLDELDAVIAKAKAQGYEP